MNKLYGHLAVLDCMAASWSIGANKKAQAQTLIQSAENYLTVRGKNIRAVDAELRDVVTREDSAHLTAETRLRFQPK